MFFKIPVFFSMLVLLSACSEPPYTNLNNEQLSVMLEQGVVVYDIRRVDEWRKTGVIEGSELLTFADAGGRVKADFMQRFAGAVGKDEPVILICDTGGRTRALASFLVERMNFSHVYNVRNGISQWIREGRAVTRVQ